MKARLLWVLPDGQRVVCRDDDVPGVSKPPNFVELPLLRGLLFDDPLPWPPPAPSEEYGIRLARFVYVGLDLNERRASGKEIELFECDVLTLGGG